MAYDDGGREPRYYSDWFLDRFSDVGRDGVRRDGVSAPIQRRVADIVNNLHGNDGNASRTYRALRRWRRMSDRRVVEHTDGLFINAKNIDHELVVYVDRSVWVYEFDMRKEAILAEWNAICSDDPDLQVKKITVRLSTRARESGQDGLVTGSQVVSSCNRATDAQQLPPLNEEELREIDDMVMGITDPQLRLNARHAIEMTFRRKKTKN